MAKQLNPNDLVTLDELTISNMWETAALLTAWEAEDAADFFNGVWIGGVVMVGWNNLHKLQIGLAPVSWTG